MTESNEYKDRLILRRSNEARGLRALGIVIYLGILVLLISSLVSRWDFGWSITFSAALMVFLRGFLVSVREHFRRVVLHDSYISFGYWKLPPNIYSFKQIAHVETVEIKEGQWSLEPETYVKVVFDDGSVLKIQKSLMSVREFRKQLTNRAGRRFRKPPKNGKVQVQRS